MPANPGRADIANTAMRIFLAQMGKGYDLQRELPVYAKAKHFPDVMEFFGDKCCYCDAVFGSGSRAVQDHLVPINQRDVGLHAHGNVVASCDDCNGSKQGDDWRDFIMKRAGAAASDRAATVRAFVKHWKYQPEMDIPDLRGAAQELYEEAGHIGLTLINSKLRRRGGPVVPGGLV